MIYNFDEIADHGYILLSGCVEILNKKNGREKLESFPGHLAQNLQEKTAYLYEKYKIPKDKVEILSNIFYEEKIQFKYMPFRTIYTQEEFGFGEMVRNSSRIQTAVSTEDSTLLVIEKNDFDVLLRDFQVKKENLLVNRILKSSAKDELAE